MNLASKAQGGSRVSDRQRLKNALPRAKAQMKKQAGVCGGTRQYLLAVEKELDLLLKRRVGQILNRRRDEEQLLLQMP